MVLFLDTDSDHATGWEGYDYVVNRSREGRQASVERCAKNGAYAWEPVGAAELVYSGNDLVLAVPRALLGLAPAAGPLQVDFKWVDNAPETGNTLDWIDRGDVAPNGRFNYRFVE